MAAKKNFAQGRVNHVTVDEAQEAPDVVLGTLLVNSTTTMVLLILEHHILLFLLHMWRSIIYR
jgi:hypothetical protein